MYIRVSGTSVIDHAFVYPYYIVYPRRNVYLRAGQGVGKYTRYARMLCIKKNDCFENKASSYKRTASPRREQEEVPSLCIFIKGCASRHPSEKKLSS